MKGKHIPAREHTLSQHRNALHQVNMTRPVTIVSSLFLSLALIFFFFSQCRVFPVILVSSTMTSGKSTRQKQWLFLFWLHNGMAELSSCHNTTFNFCGKNTVRWPGIVVSCFCFCFFLLQLLHCAIGDDLRMTI